MQGEMKAVVVRGPFQAQIENVELPKVSPDGVLVRVKAVGVCRTDSETYSGRYVGAALPLVPGHEVSGLVVEIGKEVKNINVGERVVAECTMGCGVCSSCIVGNYNLCESLRPDWEKGMLLSAFAEYIAPSSRALHKIPEDIAFEEAALVEPTSVSVRAVKRVKVSLGESTAVLGSGTIGLLALQAARAAGACFVAVTGTERSKYRLEIARKLGADQVVNVDTDDPVSSIMKSTNQRGVDAAVISTAGSPQSLTEAIDMVKPGGRIVIVGLTGGLKSQIDVEKMVFKDLHVFGNFSSPGVWEEAIELIRSGRINVRPLITHIMPLKDFEKAFRLLESRQQNVVKVILRP